MSGQRSPSRNGGQKMQGHATTKKKDLTSEDDAYNAVFGGDFGTLEIGSYIESNEGGMTQHLPDAVDFEDEDELADEELPDEEDAKEAAAAADEEEEEAIKMQEAEDERQVIDNRKNGEHSEFEQHHNDAFMDILPQDEESVAGNEADQSNLFAGGNNELFNNMDNATYMNQNSLYTPTLSVEEQRHLLAENKKKEAERVAQEEKLLLKYYFPELKKGSVLKWNNLLYRKKSPYQWQREKSLSHRIAKPFLPTKIKFHVQPDQKKIFKSSASIWQQLAHPASSLLLKKHGIVTVALDELVPNHKEQNKVKPVEDKTTKDLLIVTDDWDQDKIVGDKSATSELDLSKLEGELEERSADWEWKEDELVDANLKQVNHALLNMNDEMLLLIKENAVAATEDKAMTPLPPLQEKSLLQKFNISNDEEYSLLRKKHQTKVRATVSNLSIEHSQPAVKLQSPYYKVAITREKARNFHRPEFGAKIRPGTNITFNKLKTRKRKRDKGRDIKESYASTIDLTIGDTAPIFLMEYSEQNPIALSNFGMANKLINYYRKTHEEDTSRPKLPVGETHVLGVQDKSPFWNFGFVEPGHIVPTLYNNMVRAPIFKHEVSGTDFLLVRSSGVGKSDRYFLRTINHLFTVGQTFPVVEIPGPNSRRVTSMRTTRLRMIVYRILNRSPVRAISLDPIAQHFPDQDYGQNRQKIKEFMKYQREGPDRGLWKLKEGEPQMDSEHIRKLISPEQVAEVDIMGQGIQLKEDNEFFNFDEKLVALEDSLMPWNISRNFINATQMRAMVQLHGIGDPTGCGEGFSFLKASMKGGFSKPIKETNKNSQANAYNVVHQQKTYEQEINRTWYIHNKSLSVTNPFEEMEDPDATNKTNLHVHAHRNDRKVLRIIRKKKDNNGVIQRQTVIINDPRIIQGYLKSKEKRTEANLDVNKILDQDTVNVNGVEELELQKKLLQTELANLEKSQQRRAARQLITKTKPTEGKVKKAKNTSRRCATCGQVGHIRTNKSCPLYNISGPGSNVKCGGASNNAGSPGPFSNEMVQSSSKPSSTVATPSSTGPNAL